MHVCRFNGTAAETAQSVYHFNFEIGIVGIAKSHHPDSNWD